MKIKSIKNNRAFLLLEVLVATTIVVLSSSLTVGLFQTGSRLYRRNAVGFDEASARIQMGRDLRGSSNVIVKQDGSLSFVLNGSTIIYDLAPLAGGSFYLRKTIDGVETKPVASYLNSLNFQIVPNGKHQELMVDMTYQKPVIGDVPKVKSVKFGITLRNSVKTS